MIKGLCHIPADDIAVIFMLLVNSNCFVSNSYSRISTFPLTKSKLLLAPYVVSFTEVHETIIYNAL